MGLEPKPYLDRELIDQTFRQRAAAAHPDHTGDTAVFQELHTAATLLRSPASRLRFLAGSAEKKSTSLPTEAADLFLKIASSLNKADSVITSYHAAQGALAKAVLMGSLQTSQLEISSLRDVINDWQYSLEKKLQELDKAWPAVEASELLALADEFTFASRWKEQISERLLALTTLFN